MRDTLKSSLSMELKIGVLAADSAPAAGLAKGAAGAEGAALVSEEAADADAGGALLSMRLETAARSASDPASIESYSLSCAGGTVHDRALCSNTTSCSRLSALA